MNHPAIRTAATLLALATALAGCGRVPEGNAHAGGVIRLSTGEPLTGVVGIVRFDPEELYTGGSRGASVGWLSPDGTFKIMTHEKGDGVPLGDYRIVLVVKNQDGGIADRVHVDYKHFETTPWRARVEKGQKNHFVFTLDPVDQRPVIDHGLPDHDY